MTNQSTEQQVRVRPMSPADWPAVRDIYAEGIATGDATFETSAPEWPAWDAGHTPEHRFVATGDPVSFATLARRFLGPEVSAVEPAGSLR